MSESRNDAGTPSARQGLRWMATVLACLVGCTKAPPPAPSAPRPAPAAKVSAEAKEAIDGMARFLASKKGFSFRQSSVTKASGSDAVARFAGTKVHDVLVERPNRVRVSLSGDGGPVSTAVSDGSTLVFHQAGPNRYESPAAPATIDEIVEKPLVSDMLSAGRGDTLLRALLASDPAAALLDGIGEATLVGREAVDGRECVRVAVTSPSGDWDVWIASGEEPVPLRFVPAPVAFQLGGQDGRAETTVALTEWRFDPSTTPADFTFAAPDGARAVESIDGDNAALADQRAFRRPPRHASVGTPASPVRLAGGDGATFDLADHKDAIVVLDFWSSSNEACRDWLPIVARVCADYADKGIVFRSVNVKEDGDAVARFLGEIATEAPVLIDADGAVAEAYGVAELPHTVIVGPDGTIKAVSYRAAENLERRLRAQFDRLLAGESLEAPRASNLGTADEPL